MSSSARARRMARNHRRLRQHPRLNLVALMDIFTILVLFLMVNNGDVEVLQADRDIELPESVSELRPEAALTIRVSEADISVGGTPVALVADALAAPQRTLEPLAAELARLAALAPELGEAQRERGRPIIIMATRAMPYELLKRIMATCAASDFRDVTLAVNSVSAAPASTVGSIPGDALPGHAMAAALPPGVGAVSAALRGPELLLPWESSSEEDRRFSRILGLFAGGFLVVALVVPLLPVPELPQEPPRAPQHLAQVILEPVALPEPPAPPPPKPQARPKPKAVEKPPRPVQPKPVEAPAPAPEPAPRTPEQARAEAAAAGVLAFQDDLQALRENVDVDTLAQAQLSRGAATAAATERAVITSEARASSGGIRSSELSRDTGGLALSGAETTRVQSSIGGTGTRAERTHSQSAELGGRSDESIRREMDRNKGAIFAIYNQALRRNPLLQGKLVFEMVIDGSGNIAEITLLDSELDDAELTRKILARIRMIRFPAEEVLATRVNYSFDFLPYKA